ncbi:uncharacterized protein NPIL_265971 [Nephila pilipes]|uniref:PDZ domain-containing protein n=1 Tax=Nephila pilipes TaxID=299642 RepID=A0A8X6TKN2_NEPPI|nr:uncharacterized protein NPIL_265971 [Nephila pilipes]
MSFQPALERKSDLPFTGFEITKVMEDKAQHRAKLSKSIAEKVELTTQMREQLNVLKKTSGSSVDDQIVLAELEYRLVKEEMALLTLQEQHWQSAALCHVPEQMDPSDVLHSYIMSVRKNGSVPALHATDSLHPDHSVLVSCRGDLPTVEWAHHTTDLQAGDRLLEVNGHLVISKDSTEVTRLLNWRRPHCRIVFLRPLRPHQWLKGGGACRETAQLRQELTAVVERLNRQMAESTNMNQLNERLKKDQEELKSQNRQLKLQVLSLQSLLLYLHKSAEKSEQTDSTVFDLLGAKSILWRKPEEDNT